MFGRKFQKLAQSSREAFRKNNQNKETVLPDFRKNQQQMSFKQISKKKLTSS